MHPEKISIRELARDIDDLCQLGVEFGIIFLEDDELVLAVIRIDGNGITGIPFPSFLNFLGYRDTTLVINFQAKGWAGTDHKAELRSLVKYLFIQASHKW